MAKLNKKKKKIDRIVSKRVNTILRRILLILLVINIGPAIKMLQLSSKTSWEIDPLYTIKMIEAYFIGFINMSWLIGFILLIVLIIYLMSRWK